MIWRSVVGKLWLTIIGLVTLVLMLLSLILSEQLEKTVNQGHQKYLLNLARHIQESLQDEAKPDSEYVSALLRVTELFDVHSIILGPDKSTRSLNGSPGSPEIPWQAILKETEIERVYQGKEVVLRGRVQVGKSEHAFPLFKDEILLAAVPLKSDGKVTGAVVLYQEHDQLTETDIKRWIVYSALISIFLTTIFAFFLSTRITQPLIQMKRAAEKMAQGHFSIRLPVRQRERDEIGDLAISFNRMAEQLHESVEALSHEKEQLASILRSMVDGVITMDAEGKIIVVNPPAERLLASWSVEEEESGSLPPPLREIFRTVVRDERDHAADVTLHGRTWAVVMAPLYAGDQVRGAVAVLRDVTEERRMDKLRKDFVANVSHELRTPLSMLQGYSEALLDDIAQSPEMRRELAQVIHDETLRMGRLVRDLLDLARMESGHIEIERTRVSVSALIKRVVRKFQGLAGEQKVNLKWEVQSDLPEVYWDEDKVEQVLTNLVDNAIRHTPEGGEICLKAAPSNGKKVSLTVRDTGSGIPEEDLPFIFERFYKADKARTRGQSGTGLGLAIVKHMVDAHGGTVSVESRLGEGTTFTVKLPVGSDGEK